MKSHLTQKIVKTLKLKPHPEGGFFRENYRCKQKVKTSSPAFPKNRSYSTSIYFLLPRGSVSKLHRIKSDEVWHFYLGGSITIVEISPRGRLKKTILGSDLSKGELLQYVVPAGSWFGSYPNSKTVFALVGCTVSPGFDFKDFEMGERSFLLKKFPKAKKEILRLS